jgi:hypothetical protein
MDLIGIVVGHFAVKEKTHLPTASPVGSDRLPRENGWCLGRIRADAGDRFFDL